MTAEAGAELAKARDNTSSEPTPNEVAAAVEETLLEPDSSESKGRLTIPQPVASSAMGRKSPCWRKVMTSVLPKQAGIYELANLICCFEY